MFELGLCLAGGGLRPCNFESKHLIKVNRSLY